MNPGLTVSIPVCAVPLCRQCCSLHVSTSFIHIFSNTPTHCVAQISQMIEKCRTPSSHVHPPSVRRSGLPLVAEHLEEATLSGRLCERKRRRDGVELGSMAAEGWYDGAWNDWRWRIPDHWNSLSLSNPRAGWMWHGGEQHSPWPQWSPPGDITSNDPRQSGDERSEVIPCWNEIEALWEAGLLDPREAETKEPSHVGRWRQPKEYKPLEKDRLTRVQRAGALPEVVPLPQKQSGTYSVQGIEAREGREASDDEWEASCVKRRRAEKSQPSGRPEAELDELKPKCAM